MGKPTLLQSLSDLASKLGVSTPDGVPGAAYTDPGREELIIRYLDGTFAFGMYEGRQFIKVRCKMYKLNGEEDGHHEGIGQVTSPDVLQKVFNRPPAPEPPFDEPKGPMVHFPIASYSEGMWTFGDGSTICAVGPAILHAIQYINTASQLWVSADQLITGGTGRYAGVQGVKTVGGSSWVKGNPFTGTGPIMIRILEVFRIVRRENHIAPQGAWGWLIE